jgi:hypothetical protein
MMGIVILIGALALLLLSLGKGIQMDIKKLIESFTGDKKEAEELKHRSMTGSRFILLLAFGGLIIWATKGILNTETMSLLFWAFITYTICNTATRIAQYGANAFIRGKAMDLAWKDGKISKEEQSIVENSDIK